MRTTRKEIDPEDCILSVKKKKVVVDTGVLMSAFISNAKVIIPKKKLLICRAVSKKKGDRIKPVCLS